VYVIYWGPSVLTLVVGFCAYVSRNRVALIAFTSVVTLVACAHIAAVIAVLVLDLNVTTNIPHYVYALV
jgi:hypothetical protein